MATNDEQTCGKGLAEHSTLHTKLAELMASVAENLELHMAALDRADENARKEHEAYAKLVAAHRRLAGELRATGEEMAGYHDLPIGRHDPDALSSPRIVEAFEKFARVESELLALLAQRVEQNERMLGEITTRSARPQAP